MPDTSKSKDVHLYVPIEEFKIWEEHKERKYNGLPAMAKMIRDFVNEGIEREQAGAKRNG